MADKITEYGLSKDVRDKLNHMGNYVISTDTLGAAKKDHTHPISEVTNLTQELANKSDKTHTHSINEVTNLQKELDNLSTKIDKKVEDATGAVPDEIKKSFDSKTVYVDQVNGKDINSGTKDNPFQSIKAAVYSVPDGGSVVIRLPDAESQQYYNFTDGGINIGSRNVTISAVAGEPILRCEYFYESGAGCIASKGYFTLLAGGVLHFTSVRILLPRGKKGEGLGIIKAGAVVTGTGVVSTTYAWNSSNNHIITPAGDGVVVPLVRSGGREVAGNIRIFLAHTNLELANATDKIFELQYSTGTAIFAEYATRIVSPGSAAKLNDLFSGLAYGTHGYATNLLAAETITKRPA